MQGHAVGEDAIEAGERFLLADALSATLGQRLAAAALDDPAPRDDQGLARQHAADAGEDRVAAGGELQLQQFVARLPHQLGGTSAAGE